MERRPGTTLVEVLVAIFVMGLGLIALLTLFPIGALRMAQSIHDDRCVQAAQTGLAMAIAHDVCNDRFVVSDPKGAIADLFVNPSPAKLADADPLGPSYAVWVDPIGYSSVPLYSLAQNWVGGMPNVLRRRPVFFVGTSQPARNQNIYRSFTLLDDINFDPGQAPATPLVAGNTTRIFRDTRFSWAYLLQRSQTSQADVVDCSVVVFNNRPLALTGNLTLEEYVYPNTRFDPITSTITITYGVGLPPPVAPGNWILDATIVNPTATTGTQHANFYRVVAVEELNNASVRVEVQTTIRTFPAPTNAAFKGTAIVIPAIAEVFEKGPLRPTP